ncbi:MAG: response regulator transcription factor [Armatimonadota bacterium]
MAEKILIVEDETGVAEAVSYALEQEGFETEIAADGQDALDAFEQFSPDLVILDLMLPRISGYQLFSAFRKDRAVPIIMLTARVEETDRVAGLEMGADDYVTKPFSIRELTARVRAVLRRSQGTEEPERLVVSKGGVKLDGGSRQVFVEEECIELSPKEFDLLAYLMKHAGRVRTREDILRNVWEQTDFLDERTVDVHISWLRKKIEDDPTNPTRLLTVRGVGYRFVEE